jgi:hypothetical protein
MVKGRALIPQLAFRLSGCVEVDTAHVLAHSFDHDPDHCARWPDAGWLRSSSKSSSYRSWPSNSGPNGELPEHTNAYGRGTCRQVGTVSSLVAILVKDGNVTPSERRRDWLGWTLDVGGPPGNRRSPRPNRRHVLRDMVGW